MQELIKVATNDEGNQVVSARELHEFLEVKSNFPTWCKRMFGYGFEENKDYILINSKNGINLNGGRPEIDYALILDTSKEIAMLQRSEKGKQARLYFIECEKQVKKQLPQTYKEALLALVAKEEEKEKLLLKVDNLSTALDSLVEWISIIKVSQFNKIHENNFNWPVLKKKSEQMGYEIKKGQSNRYDYQNLYHVNVFKACYPQFNYNFL